ncbi:olfactory receptor 49-like [Eublepharis macularius]|uniref:Olfactory receptor n=1 Tax=Eublepharis macularius TaxID=481883 RepID=A0AA97K7J5_EUBMA|nr:olfactory receptor 49-like [Eublepharis macularius]
MNSSTVREFILLGLTDNPQLEILFFCLFFVTYLLTVTGNMVIIAITLKDHRLSTPMYFFLRHFAVLEIGFTTCITPKALANMATGHKKISLSGCFTQFFLYFVLGATEFFLLAVMSFDRYVAICNPLRYSAIMNGRICSLLVFGSWLGGFLLILGPAAALFHMPFCGPNIVNHFFCDKGPLIKLVCIDTSLLDLVYFIAAIFILSGTLTVNVVSYINIISSVISIPSGKGRQKAFSTCASHIIVVSLTYGSCMFMYIKPKGTNEFNFSKSVAVLNTIVSPLLNPFIYCLRNKQVQGALKTAFRQSIEF